MKVITTTDALATFCADCARAPYVTVDTEFLRERTYWSQLCLVQLARPAVDGAAEDAAIVDALAQRKRVFVDVTAVWCVTCKANKYNVLLRDEVQSALTAPDVVALRGDWSRPSDAISAFLRQRGAAAVPFNQIYGPGLPEGEILSPLLDKADLLDVLHQAGLVRADVTHF